ncbi:MAG: tetratricopeptide repeat protein [Thermoplasmata archaeon]|nr:tetratricopeptide repeat protein [Thermoplasmata archaeon]
MNNHDLKEELISLLEREVGFTGKFILMKQCQHLDIDPDDISPEDLAPLSNQIHWAIRSFTGDKKADEIKKGIMQYKGALDTAAGDEMGDDGDPVGSIKAQLTIGEAKMAMGKHEESDIAFRKAVEIYTSSGLDDASLWAKIMRKLAQLISTNKDGREEAKELYRGIIAQGMDDDNQTYDVALAWNGLASLFWREGEHKESLKHYMEALGIIKVMPTVSKNERRKKKRAMATIHLGLGNTHLDLLNMEDSIEHNKKAIAMFTELEDFSGVGLIYNNLARVYEEMERFAEAIDGYKRGIRYLKDGGSLRMEGWTMTNLASALIEIKKPKEALPHLEKASKILSNFSDPIAHSKLHCMYGKYYSAVMDFKESENHFNKSISYIADENSPDYLAIAQEEMGKMYFSMGRMEKAEELLKAAMDWYIIKEEKARMKNIKAMLDEM